jgi:hypothetical protein
MEYKNGTFTATEEEIKALLSSAGESIEWNFNPVRLKMVWAQLNCSSEGRQPPLTHSQYQQLLKMYFKLSDAEGRRNLEKYTIFFKVAYEYARGVGRGTYHYLAELYALKANMAIFTLLSMTESLERAKQRGDTQGLDTLIADGVLTPEELGTLQDYIGEDGNTYFRYGGKNKEDIRADMERGLKYLYANMKGFKADIEAMLKYLQELIPASFLEPFGRDIKHALPLALQGYIQKMEIGFIEEAGVDINETTSGKSKHKIYPTYSGVKADKRAVEAQYKSIKRIVERRWQNE